MSSKSLLFTSESVTMGHPDKIADQISDAILDAYLTGDPMSRVACETMITTGMAVVAGEITSGHQFNIPDVVRKTIRDIGYDASEKGFDANTCAILVSLDRQSSDIAMGVDEKSDQTKEQGAGDQGMMFGFACDEAPEFMPAPIYWAHRLVEKMAEVRRNGKMPYLRPDGKSQVTIEYAGGKPVRAHTVVVSNQHAPEISQEQIQSDVLLNVIQPTLPPNMMDKKTIVHVNPTGRFVLGGPLADCGLTGRKIIVDTYGGMGRHGGGAFSGKDPSKVDRSAAYAARYVAKNVVAAGIAARVEIQLAYAIGVAQPVSVNVNSFGTGKISDDRIEELVRSHFKLTPRGIIESLNLRRPIYGKTAAHGHFGRKESEFTWERTDKAAELKRDAGL